MLLFRRSPGMSALVWLECCNGISTRGCCGVVLVRTRITDGEDAVVVVTISLLCSIGATILH
jgi:hypothetical protein